MAKPTIVSPESLPEGCACEERPNVFLVGAPKCGTTAMAHYLGLHPDMFMAQKEMNVFGRDLHFEPKFYRRDLNAYMAEFKGRGGRRCAGDASVWYLLSKCAAEEIKAFNPDARIIVMLREPSEMLYSLYYQFRFDGNEHLPTFEEALASENDRRAGRKIGRQTYFPQGLVYREAARYTEQLKRYFEVFGRSRVHVIIYDDFAADVEACYRSTLEFLGLDSTRVEPDFKVVNGNKTVRNPAIRALLGDRLVQSTVVSLARKLPRPVFDFLHDTERRLWKMNERPVKRPELDPALRAELRREFAPEVERLSQLLGRDLSHWGQPVPVRRETAVRVMPTSAPALEPAGPFVVVK